MGWRGLYEGNEGEIEEGNLIPLTFLLYLMVYCHPSSLVLLFFLFSLLDTRLVNLSQLTTLLTTAEMLLLSPTQPPPITDHLELQLR